jgi:hypothetical protein
MKVVVDNKYTYETDLEVQMGDEVILPTPSFLLDVKGPTFTGEVTALTSDYTGWCAKILGIKTPKKVIPSPSTSAPKKRKPSSKEEGPSLD